MTKHKQLYKIWEGIKQRCYNPNHRKYHRYGGRDIKMCLEWYLFPQVFIEYWLNNDWEQGLQIDRIDDDGDYSPENCQLLPNRENTLKAYNYGLRSNNTTGYRGVYWNVEKNKYEVRLCSYGKSHFIGYHELLLDAVRAWNDYVIQNGLEEEYNLQEEPVETEGNKLFRMLANL